MATAIPRRVVITGVGLVCPVGNSPERLWDALTTGRSGVGPLLSVPTQFLPIAFAAEAREFTGEIENFGPLEKLTQRAIKKGLKVMCREIQMGVASAQLALHDAGLDVARRNPERTGVSFGSDYIITAPEDFADGIRNCLGPDGKFDFSLWGERGIPKVDPLWLLKYLPNMPASHIAIYNELRGPSNSITLREASANLAVGEAYATILRGSADAIVAGATGTRIHPIRTVHVLLQEEVATCGADPAQLCRPFDLHRAGMVLGEGAGAVVLEELGAAQTRGAKILGEVVGHASSAAIEPSGVAAYGRAIKNVLQQSLSSAKLPPDSIGHVHAHGLATHRCDAEEAQAIRDVFQARRVPVPVTAAKSYFGNLGAGSGAVELIASLLALHHDRLFPILNCDTPDPECPIHAVRERDASPGDSFINVNVTPQGQASAVVVRKFVA